MRRQQSRKAETLIIKQSSISARETIKIVLPLYISLSILYAEVIPKLFILQINDRGDEYFIINYLDKITKINLSNIDKFEPLDA